MKKEYARYEDVDKEQLRRDIDEIKVTIGDPTQEDFHHLLKLKRWGKGAALFGFSLVVVLAIFELNLFLF